MRKDTYFSLAASLLTLVRGLLDRICPTPPDQLDSGAWGRQRQLRTRTIEVIGPLAHRGCI